MHVTNLRKVGGSVMLAVPPSLLDILQLRAGASVGITLEGERLVIEAAKRPRYTLSDLLAASDYPATPSDLDRDWLNAPSLGGELL